MDRIEPEFFGLDGPLFADELVRRKALQGLQPAPKFVSCDEVCEVTLELVVGLVVVALDGGVLDRAVHPLDLSVGPGMLRLCEAVLDTELCAGVFEGMRPDGLSLGQRLDDQGRGRSPGARRREVRAVVGQDFGDPVGDRFDEMAQEVASGAPFGFSVKLDEGELAGPIDGDEHVELALRGLYLGDVGVEEADRVALELRFDWLLAFDLRQAADPVTLQATMQG